MMSEILPDSELAFVFPGQGSQSPGMLAELALSEPIVIEAFAEASEGIGLDLWALTQEPEGERLNQTEYTQPALLAAGVAIWRLWLTRGGGHPACLAGHSLGEYTALVAAGALSLIDGARLVRERGRLMQAAVPAGAGAMAAILGADDVLVAEVCREVSGDGLVVPANYNSPGQIVVGGDAAAVDRLIAALADRGVRKTVRLQVSVPSHTPLMAQAAERLAETMGGLVWREPIVPVIQNADAAVHHSVVEIRDALARQLYQPVRWTECVQALAAAGVSRIAECGPGKVLVNLIRRIDRGLDARALGTPAELDAAFNAWNE